MLQRIECNTFCLLAAFGGGSAWLDLPLLGGRAFHALKAFIHLVVLPAVDV